MVKNIIHNPVFRIFTPIFYGVTMYILILLIFDTIEQLSQNFFSFEVFLCVIITYLIFEFLRLYAIIVEKKCPANCSIGLRILIQGGGSIVIAFIITFSIITFYFTKLVGFSSFSDWLAVFNTIFILTSVLFNMIYFSFFYLNRINVTQLEQESILRQNAEIELNTYKNKINPEFLYDSLESLISLAKKNTEEADQFILKLSDVYRNILSNKKSQLTPISDELNISKTLIEIFNYKLNGNLNFEIDKSTEKIPYHIISGTMVVVIEDIVNRSVISGIQPIEIKGEIEENILKIYHPVQNKLVQIFSKKTELKHLKNAYLYYGKKSISIKEENNIRSYNIPVFELEN